ncbi:phage portal protein [Nocardiopsis lucentensis]|uniref:phage portal protein n=1 Tax=Nocardiopsis lucentensis TaxID=53441 RepID=UPI000345FBE3|nr:phage portal protein [Nocardiopsis lucentensis]
MALNPAEAAEKASELFELRNQERKRLDRIRLYLRGKPELTYLPTSAPRELQALAIMSRINLMGLIVKATTQQMFVDGYTATDQDAADTIWTQVWQSNRWDRRQIALHKSAAAYGVSYGTILPADGDGAPPVIRAHSPRQMTAAYTSDDDWPDYALEQRQDGTWRLYDSEEFYDLRRIKARRGRGDGPTVVFEQTASAPHEQNVTPVVRYLADEDLDDPVQGDIEPNMTLQDQINLCTLHLLVAQHYGAHGRKVLIGLMMDEIQQQLQSSASTTLVIKAKPDEFKVEELSQTQLDGFLASRESAARFVAAISQTPTHELLGTLSNLAATALLESRESTARKVAERKIIVGESHEQLLGQAGTLLSPAVEVDPAARVRWKPVVDTRTMQFVETLALLADKLGVPEEELWRETPFSDATINSWKRAREEMQDQPQEGTQSTAPSLAAL